MRLVILDMLAVQIFALPLYFLLLWSVFFIHFFKRKSLTALSVPLQADHAPVYDTALVSRLGAPVLLLLSLWMSTIRAHEGFFCFSQACLVAQNIKIFYIIFSFFLFNFVINQAVVVKTTQYFLLELFVFNLWLVLSYFWVLFVTNLVIYLFFFEIFGLLLIMAVLYMYLATSRASRVGLASASLFNAAYGGKVLLIQTILFFLWSSALSMILLFWACTYIVDLCYSLELSLLEVYMSCELVAANQGGRVFGSNLTPILIIFFYALLVKAAAAPLHP